MMNIRHSTTVCTFLAAALLCSAQVQPALPVKTSLSHEKMYSGSSYDIFIPIGKYLAAGDEESLSAWFAPNLEIVIFGNPSEASKIQARQIMKSFFRRYKPRSFDITHQAGREKQKYALGDLNASGEHFLVTIFVSNAGSGSFQIQQIKIDRM